MDLVRVQCATAGWLTGWLIDGDSHVTGVTRPNIFGFDLAVLVVPALAFAMCRCHAAMPAGAS